MIDDRYFNRELSLLDFQDRVLALGENPEVPLLERVKFLAIVSSNLDEFFQVRVAGLKEQVLAGVPGSSPDGMTARQQLDAIRERVVALNERRDALFIKELLPALEANGIALSGPSDLDEEDRAELDRVFDGQIFPVLTPLAVDPAHPFPFISDLSLNLAVLCRDPRTGRTQFARVKVPPILPRFLVMPDGERFVALEHVIADHLDRLFPGMEIIGHYPFRVTRNADLAIEQQEADDLLEAMEEILQSRHRFSRAVRLEVHPDVSDAVVTLLMKELRLAADELYVQESPLDLSGLWALHSLDRPDLKDPPWAPVTQPRLADSKSGDPPDFFEVMRRGDLLVHVPYESFATSNGAFIARAAADPTVLAIKQTLYRTSVPDDPARGGEEAIVRSLMLAAQTGKQVVVLVELRARFDEEANIRWARMLEESGVHVVYGVVGLKTHSKIALVVRKEGGELRRYCTIGTGNYNPKTARIYEDLHLFTADQTLGADLSDLFNVLTGFGEKHKYRKLLVAPTTLRSNLLRLIRKETKKGEAGRICFKMNHIVDPRMIDSLYEASTAGVQIDLFVRGICCLRPGVPGMSERIRVRSLVGEFLEHSRIYRFGVAGEGATYLIGSADLMQRNLNGRVEAVTPVTDPVLQERMEEILSTNLADDVLAWELGPDGHYRKVQRVAGINAQERMKQLALERSRGGT
jgi:polyphosphate kinase